MERNRSDRLSLALPLVGNPGQPTSHRPLDDAQSRHDQRALPVLQHRDGRGDRRHDSGSRMPARPLPTTPSANQPSGMDPSLFEYRPPIDLSNPRLRKLAAALGPAYVRVSGTWANTTYLSKLRRPAAGHASELASKPCSPASSGRVSSISPRLSMRSSSPPSPSARELATEPASGPRPSAQILAYTKSVGGKIAAAEYMNEPNLRHDRWRARTGYDAAAYGRDFAVFRAFAKQSAPGMLILGPAAFGRGAAAPAPASIDEVALERKHATSRRRLESMLFSYHSYDGVSSRCAPSGIR